jgi:glycerol-3-phosphate acyltransferase PlsY
MKILIFVVVPVMAYLISALNPAIILSKAVYKKDIRNEGSGNPGFTNFKRVFGGKLAWAVFFLDILKGAVISVIAGLLFMAVDLDFDLGVAYAAIFAMLGHAFPVYYGFKGGKGFLVALSTSFFLDWRAGLVATLVMVVLVLTAKYMSLATMAGLLCGVLTYAAVEAKFIPCLLFAFCVIFMIARHHENIDRLINGTEKKFSLGHKKEA